jgi:hypothetical protein
MIQINTQTIRNYSLYYIFFIITFLFFHPHKTYADHDLLIKYITEYNLEEQKKILSRGTSQGEAGILMIKPEVGQSLGLDVFIDDDYRAAVKLFKNAEKHLDQAIETLKSSRNNEEKLLKQIVDLFLQHKAETESARQKMTAYHSRLKPGLDERLDEGLCRLKMVELLNQSLEQTDYQLRDALAHFYNRCRDNNSDKYHLTPDNVLFVNFVYRNFLNKASTKEKERFKLDLETKKSGVIKEKWKKVARAICPQYMDILERIIPKYQKEIYEVDPLLFMALIKRESNFNPRAISSVGAAGLTQIMPGTAIDLGMKPIFRPSYFDQAGKLLRQERGAEREALSTLNRIDKENGIKVAQRARKLMKKSLSLGKKREQLFTRYKVELLKRSKDSRLNPETAIKHGFIYFVKQMKAQDGDISLALASYNAGPHRVKKYQGIPPFDETVHFRNVVLSYYYDFSKRAEK